MVPVLVAGLVGAWAMYARAPRTKHKKYKAFGPRTGQEWEVEAFPDLGVVAVRGHASVGVFKPNAEGRFEYMKGTGNREAIELMKKDFLP